MADNIDAMTTTPSNLSATEIDAQRILAKIAALGKTTQIYRVRCHVDRLEHNFLRTHMFSWTRYEKWNKILRGATYDLRNGAQLQQFRASITVDLEELILTIVGLCGESVDHTAPVFNLCGPLYDEDLIREMLLRFKITPDRSKIDAVLTIQRPIHAFL